MEHYRISFSGDGHSIELSSHEKEWVEKKMKEFGIEAMLKEKPEPKKAGIKHEEEKTEPQAEILTSMTESEFYRKYVKEKKIESRPDICTFFVYYLSKIKKLEQITTNEVRNCFKEIGYPNWNTINITDSLSKAKKKAFLNNINDVWLLTMTGEDYVINLITE
jgi:hypothetical protein